jgi:proline dehydrogenase
MLQSVLLWVSRSRVAARLATSAPGLRSFSRRFVAGVTRDEAIAAVRKLNSDGLDATVSYLGEAVSTVPEVEAALAEFGAYIDAVRAHGLRSHVSIKLTELGLAFDAELAARSLERVLEHANSAGMFVRVDMEDSRYTQATLDIVRAVRARFPECGTVVQSALMRSDDDVIDLAREGVPVRLVKGAYREPEDIAWQDKGDVDAAYARLLEVYCANAPDDAWLAVATHDGRMIRAALKSAAAHGMGRERIEFQLLYGIRPDLQRQLRAEGHRVRIYVPYGSQWFPYLMRRLAERPANLWFFLRHSLSR